MRMRKFVWKITRVTNKTSQICQYRICPPLASMRPHNDDAYSWWLWQSVAGVSSSTPPARLRPKLRAFLVAELSVVHASRECTKHARLATSRGIEQANRDDPHCSAAGTAVLSSSDEILRCHVTSTTIYVRRGGSNEYPQYMFLAEIWKILDFFFFFWWW